MACKFHTGRKAAFALDNLMLCAECANGAAKLITDKMNKIEGNKMKTVKDVCAVYKEWPSDDVNHAIICRNGDIIFDYYEIGSFNSDRFCTREQYEQYKAEQEKAMETKCDWYDYEKGEGIPPIGTECEVSNCGNDYIWCKVLFMGNSICLVDHKIYSEQRYRLGSVKFRPLDHDKHSKKVAPMGWGVKSGIDFEVSNDCEVWIVSDLSGINDSYDYRFNSKVGSNWKYCRPRMNHKHVLTGEQFGMIPDCFVTKWSRVNNELAIVEFIGLKDGYVWEGE